MTPEEHQAEHIRLHKSFDQLLACFMQDNREGTHIHASIHDQILDLLHWSYEKTMKPTPPPEISHDARTPAEFECDRQIIVLALAELALSRPGFEPAIQDIAHHYDGEGLPMFEKFKQANADRVRAERSPV